MVDIAVALFRRALAGLANRRSKPGGIRALLSRGSYAIDAMSADVVRFDGIDSDELLSCVLSDYSRFALASLESRLLATMPYYTPRAVAWPLVKDYYAAFYAGHAVLRATGTGIVRIDDALPSSITRLGRIYVGPTFTFVKGTYRYEIGGLGQTQMSLTLTRLDSSSAIHASFWEHFSAFLNELGNAVVRNQEPQSAQIVGRLEEFARLLRGAGGDSSTGGLSEFRNAVNYRHEYGVWFPFAPSNPRDRAASLPIAGNASVRLDIDGRNQPIRAFQHAAIFMASLNYDLAELVIARAASKREEFVVNWQRLKSDAAA